MDDAEGVPEDDVGVGDVGGGVGGDPFGEAAGGVAGGLGDVAAGGVDLCVVVWMGRRSDVLVGVGVSGEG